MQSRQRQPSIQQSNVSPVPTTIFHRLPQSHQQQLAHLIADIDTDLIRRARTAAQNREGDHER